MAESLPEGTRKETERVRLLQDKEAPRYDRQMGFFDRVLFEGGRDWACSRVEGEVLEIAVGTGRNLPHHRDDITLTGIELSPEMLNIAKERAQELGHTADLRVGDAQALDFPDGSFDSCLCTLALCTIPNPGAAVREVYRVLRPGGRFALLEHVRSPARPVRGVQRAIEPLSVRFAADHLTREPLEYLHAVGFEVEEMERSKWGIVERVLARRPGLA
jgi:ubiquinone/menaquinone biosynthesis C-methylase UbiE